jgi:Tfp pilus assembly protein PilF
VWELLRVRTQELRDRLPQLSRDASPELRAGLGGLSGDDAVRAVDRLRAAPDRVRDGFDLAVAGRLHAGMRALAEDDLRAARHHATRVTREAGDDPLAHALRALVAQRDGDTSEHRDALRRAFALAPDEPAIALELARLEAEHADFPSALAAARVYVAAVPEDARTAAWAERIAAREALTRRHARRTHAGVTVLFDPRAVSDARLHEVASRAATTLDRIAHLTRRPRRAELAVIVYADRESMRSATCAPVWSGGMFDGALHLDAATVAGPRWARVVQHETTHAQLATLRGAAPLWLEEGLAQWMEGEPDPSAVRAWRTMVERDVWIPFASLEGSLVVIDDAHDASRAYHQSLAMLLLLLERRGERAIESAATLVESGQREDLLEQLLPSGQADGRTLLAFLRAREDVRGVE